MNLGAFASQSQVKPAAVIKIIVDLLQQPLEEFGKDLSQEIEHLQTVIPVGSHPQLPRAVQAQLHGLLLSILLLLSLSDNVSLKQHLHEANVEQLLLKLARNETSNVHPYLRHCTLEEECPNVLSKLAELYR